MSMLKNIKIVKVLDYTSAAFTDPATTEIDMLGFDSACIQVNLGTVTDTADLTVTLKGSNTAGGASAGTAISGASVVRTGMTNTAHSNTQLVIDMKRSPYRYVYVFVDRGTANCVIENVFAYLYSGKAQPVTQPSAVKTDSIVVA